MTTLTHYETEYLTFDEDASTAAEVVEGKRKTTAWIVRSRRHGDRLGRIQWYGPWRQYVFAPEENTLWNAGCLSDLQIFLINRMGERKQKTGSWT